jgi:hypothetical protein
MLLGRLAILGQAARVAAGGAFTPALASPSSWYDPSDISTLFQDSAGTTPVTAHGDPVGRMLDKSGNGNHLSQATAASRPLYQVSGAEKYLLFDGIDDALSGTIAGMALPFDRISAIRQITWVAGDRIFATGVSDAGWLIQRTSSPIIEVRDGINTVVQSGGLAIGANGVVTERHVAANSQLAVNNGAYSSGNAGSTAPGTTLIIGAGVAAGTNGSNIRYYGSTSKVGQFTTEQIALIRTWLGAKCGLSL